MRIVAYIGGLLGLALFVALMVHADISVMIATLRSAGSALLWVVPYRAVFFLLYAAGWMILLRPNDPVDRVGLGYLFWVATVRESVDRLLPVASVGGSVVGVRLVCWRGLSWAPVGASVIVEIVLTLVVSYVFTAVGLFLLVDLGTSVPDYRRIVLILLLSLPIPVVLVWLLRYGTLFERLQGWAGRLVGKRIAPDGAASLDRELRDSLHRTSRLFGAGALQLAALTSGSFEIWFALRTLGHPIGTSIAVALEGMTLAVRHIGFMVPAALGIQEAGLVLFGHAVGIDSELALAVSVTKRIRELLWGVPALLSWQWFEGRRLGRPGL